MYCLSNRRRSGRGEALVGAIRVKGTVLRVFPWQHQLEVVYTDDFRVDREA